MYYVRKLSKPSSLFKLQALDNFQNIPADFLGQDLRTSANTLSVWRSESLNQEDINKAINAALLASSQVNTSQFLIIDSDALEQAGIRTDDTEPGITGYELVFLLSLFNCGQFSRHGLSIYGFPVYG